MATQLHEWEQGTRVLFGKPYYWDIVDGKRTLRPGLSPTDIAKAEAALAGAVEVKVDTEQST